jgi:hypothetical protein
LLSALPVYAQSTGSDPWDNAVNVLKTAFTGSMHKVSAWLPSSSVG